MPGIGFLDRALPIHLADRKGRQAWTFACYHEDKH